MLLCVAVSQCFGTNQTLALKGEKTIESTTNDLTLSEANGRDSEMVSDAKPVAMELPVNTEQRVSKTLVVKAKKQFDFKTGELKLAITTAGLADLPAKIEIYDSANQSLLKQTHTEGETFIWPVPTNLEGKVRIVAHQTDSTGKKHTGEVMASTRRFGTGKQTGGSMKDKVGLWRNYEYIDGLASNWIFPMLEAHDGALWIGTWTGGVSRFDGQTWQTFTKDDGVDNAIFSILQTQDGMLYFGTNIGVRTNKGLLSRYDGQRWEALTNNDLAGRRINTLLQTNDGVLWVGADDLLLRYDEQQWYTFTKEDGWPGGNSWTWSLLQTEDGTLWAGKDYKLYRYDGQVWQAVVGGLASQDAWALLQTKDGALWAGGFQGKGLSRYDGQKMQTFTIGDGLDAGIWTMLQTQDGMLWVGGDGSGLARYDGQRWRIFSTEDGLPGTPVRSLVETDDGTLLIGTWSGLSHYYREQWQNITKDDGLPSNEVNSLLKTEDGVIWVGTNGGFCRYDGKTWRTFTTDYGLASNGVRFLTQTSDDALWVKTGDGLSRYDGREWITFTTDDGLPENNVSSLVQTSDGVLWVGTGSVWFGGSLSRYDGQNWQIYDIPIKEPQSGEITLLQSQDGALWLGTYWAGVFHYDGKEWMQFNESDGLVGVSVESLLQTLDSTLWVGTNTGLSRYDGESWQSFTQKDGLLGISVQAILQTSDGKLWFGTRDGGLNVYDGRCFQSINTEDGLVGNNVTSLLQADDGALWIGTDKGISRIIPHKTPPRPWIRYVTADDERFENPKGKVQVSGPIERLSVEYRGITFHTRKGGIKYFTQLVGVDNDWRKSTNEERVEYTNLEPGDYIFKMQAVDRFLNYSEIASLTLKITPPFYMRAIFLGPTISFGTILLATLTVSLIFLVKHRKQIRAYERTAVEELRDANKVQMSLMPETAPPIEGVEIAGKCLPANTVSGDFFDYLEGKDNTEIALVVADVTGKAMKGAMNAVMTDGILRTAAIEQEQFTPASLMITLNNALKARLEQYMNVTMVIGMIDSETNTLTISNAAHHAYPLILRDGEIQILKTGGLPLGMRAGIQYTEEQFQLQSGDVLILMTDGIIEAKDSEDNDYSESGHLEETIIAFTPQMSAETMVDAVINGTINYSGDKNQRDDDMTVIVAKIE